MAFNRSRNDFALPLHWLTRSSPRHETHGRDEDLGYRFRATRKERWHEGGGEWLDRLGQGVIILASSTTRGNQMVAFEELLAAFR